MTNVCDESLSIHMLEEYADKDAQEWGPINNHLYPGLISIDDTFRDRLQA